MLRIGTLPSQELKEQFLGYLFTRGVGAQADLVDDEWEIWALDEDRLDEVRQELAEFQKNPAAEKFQNLDKQISKIVQEKARKLKKANRAHVNARDKWDRPAWQNYPVTYGLIAISVLVVLFGSKINLDWRLCDKTEPLMTKLYIVPIFDAANGGLVQLNVPPLTAVRQGQIWRLFTPMFIHFNPLHILFNMLWLKSLGVTIEQQRGKLRFLLMVLLIAGFSNVAQYFWSGPFFGGMSGVVFGLFGYIWMKGKTDPASGFYMPPNIVFMMLFWFVICMTGGFGPIANVAHGVGLVTGMLIGVARTSLENLNQ